MDKENTSTLLFRKYRLIIESNRAGKKSFCSRALKAAALQGASVVRKVQQQLKGCDERNGLTPPWT